jgi:hypothetical protein
MEPERGVIRNRVFGTQVRDFSGLRFGNITATDVDGLIDYQNKGWIVFETKYKDAVMPRGQRLALERHCDGLQKDKPTLLVVSSHGNESDIDMAQAAVVEFRFLGKWRRRDGTTRDLVMSFVSWLDKLWG